MRCSPLIAASSFLLLIALTFGAPDPTAAQAPPAVGFIGCSTTDNCFPFDFATHTPGAAIDLLPEGDYPYDATITPDGSQVWFVGASGDGVVVIDRLTSTVVTRFAVADYAIGVAFTSDGSLAMVTSRNDQCVKVVDTATYTVIDTLDIPTSYQGAGNIALNPVSGTFYLVDWYGSMLYEIATDGSAVLRQGTFGSSLWQLVVAPDGQHVYVTDRGTDRVLEIATATFTLARNFAVGDDPWGLDITGDGTTLAVTCEDSHQVMLIDVESGVVTPIALAASADPRDVDILDAAGLAYVTGGTVTGFSGLVYVIDLASAAVIDSFDGPGTNANVIAVQAQMHGGVSTAPVPVAILALHAYPNPFNPQVTIELRAQMATSGTLAVYDLAGRRLQTLMSGALEAGLRTFQWDGRDQTGRDLPSGLYLVRLETAGSSATQKLVLTR